MGKIMTIRPPENLRLQLKKIADNYGITVNALVLRILWDYVEHLSKK